MYKIYTSGNILYVEEVASGLLHEGHSKDVLLLRKTVSGTIFSFKNLNNWATNKVLDFSTDVDLTGAPYSDWATFITWAEAELGKSNPQVSGGQTEVWELNGDSGVGHSYTTGVSDPFLLPNDAVYTNSYNLTGSWDSVNNQLDLSGLDIGSVIELTVDFSVLTTSPNQVVETKLYGSVGHPNEWSGILGTPTTFKNVSTHQLGLHVKIPIEFQSDLDFPAEIRVSSDADMTVYPRFLLLASKKFL
jgi:hypothetical protein